MKGGRTHIGANAAPAAFEGTCQLKRSDSPRKGARGTIGFDTEWTGSQDCAGAKAVHPRAGLKTPA